LLKENKQPKGENPPNPVTLTNASIFASHFPVFVFTRKNGGGGIVTIHGSVRADGRWWSNFFLFSLHSLVGCGLGNNELARFKERLGRSGVPVSAQEPGIHLLD
jgi:hypothetical protein